MDSVGACMWADLVIGPWARASGRAKLLVWDNCGPHKVAAVLAVLAEWRVAVVFLPPNLTDVLQVMDLVVNGPLRAHARRARCVALFDCFQGWRRAREDALRAGAGDEPAFAPPKPQLADGLRVLRSVAAGLFSQAKFKEGLARSFVSVGLAEADTATGAFVEYSSHPARGTMTG